MHTVVGQPPTTTTGATFLLATDRGDDRLAWSPWRLGYSWPVTPGPG
jgi:hypothetical protein